MECQFTRYTDYWTYVEMEARDEYVRMRREAAYRFEEADMARVSEEYGGAFLKAGDLQGKTVPCQISGVAKEEFQSGDLKWVVRFQGKDKRLVLNKTNAN